VLPVEQGEIGCRVLHRSHDKQPCVIHEDVETSRLPRNVADEFANLCRIALVCFESSGLYALAFQFAHESVGLVR
jgi:hypothetical protein